MLTPKTQHQLVFLFACCLLCLSSSCNYYKLIVEDSVELSQSSGKIRRVNKMTRKKRLLIVHPQQSSRYYDVTELKLNSTYLSFNRAATEDNWAALEQTISLYNLEPNTSTRLERGLPEALVINLSPSAAQSLQEGFNQIPTEGISSIEMYRYQKGKAVRNTTGRVLLFIFGGLIGIADLFLISS